MSNAKARAEAAFTKNQRRESEINDALKEEHARHAAAIKNMQRLRALRLAQNATPNTKKVVRADTTKPPRGRNAQTRGRPTRKA